VRPKLQKRSALKLAGRTIPEAWPSGIHETFKPYFAPEENISKLLASFYLKEKVETPGEHRFYLHWANYP